MALSSASQQNVTALLLRAGDGDEEAQEELFRAVYSELRRMARRAMQGERPAHTLQPTALVHEVFVRLVGEQIPWSSRGHFFAVAATTMRRVLIDYARSLGARKRQPGKRVDLDAALLFTRERGPELIALDEALTRLEARYPRACQVVELQFFAGLTPAETAAALGVSLKTVQRDWKLSRACLYAELAGTDD
jgi:RNA polymerase sigma factor (TIGR02999 family)